MPALHLAIDLSFTHTEGAWRQPGSWVGYPYYTQPQIWEDVARVIERGKIDMVFFGDGVGVPDTWQGSIDGAVEWGVEWPRHDMSALIPLMARATEHVGFCLTFSPTFMHPYYVARQMASLDHVTRGRMAMNLITSARRSDAANYGFDELMEHAHRYERADEFIDVCRGLWSTVERDAILLDKATGTFADPARVHYLNHRGTYFNVKGPLNMVPCPQYHPLVVQAGSSPRGLESFARNSDVVFAVASDGPGMREQRRQLDAHLRAAGRAPEELIILWYVAPQLAASDAAAQTRVQEIIDSLPAEVGGIFLSHKSGFDFDSLPERFTLREAVERIEAQQGSTAYLTWLIATLGLETEVSKDDLLAIGRSSQAGGQPRLVGGPETIADEMERLHEEAGPGVGFMVGMRNFMPRCVSDFVELVVPILRKRGLVRSAYDGSTLRENLGLAGEPGRLGPQPGRERLDRAPSADPQTATPP